MRRAWARGYTLLHPQRNKPLCCALTQSGRRITDVTDRANGDGEANAAGVSHWGAEDAPWMASREPFPGGPIRLRQIGSTYFFGDKSRPVSVSPVLADAMQDKQEKPLRLLGGGVVCAVDVTKPPLRADQVERIALAKTVFAAPFVPFSPNAAKPRLLLSPSAIVHQLGPEMEAVDALFRQKGFYTPSEVAQAFVAVTPTYFVETRHVFAAVAPDILYTMEKHLSRAHFVTRFLQWYPMIFTLRKGKQQKTVVKLNTDMWFIRAHPDFKKADRIHFKNNADYYVAVGGVLSKHVPTLGQPAKHPNGNLAKLSATATGPALDAQIASLLIRRLPRVPAPADASQQTEDALTAQRCAPLKLVDWINGFPQEDIDVLNRVPEQHVVQILQRYHGVFQLMCLHGEEPLLFTPSAALRTAPQSRVEFVVTDIHATKATHEGRSPPLPERRSIRVPLAPWEEELEAAADGHATTEDSPVAANFSEDLDMDTAGTVSTNFDILYVRRRPKSVAPHSLSDFGVADSPVPDVAQLVLQYLALPPSLAKGASSEQSPGVVSPRSPGVSQPGHLWRWVPVDRIYQALSKTQRRALRPYKGLVNFLRLHGTVFELSEDLQHVIFHDPSGALAPFLPTQRSFRFEGRVVLPDSFDDDPDNTASLAGTQERELFQSVLGQAQVPTNRRQILLLDPHNPVLFHEVLYEEIAHVLPDEPVTVQAAMRSLPPILHAALPYHPNFGSSRWLVTWLERGVAMIQRSEAGKPEALDLAPCTVEEAIEAIYTVLPEDGVTVRALTRMYLSVSEVAVLTERFGTVFNAVKAFPQFFDVSEVVSGTSGDCLVRPRD